MTIDNLLAVDMVTADGRTLTASAEENPDLFWAVRGGGGNFGIVTSFLFRLHPVDTVIGGPTLWDLEDAPEVLRLYGEFIKSAPEDITGFFAFLSVPPGPPFPETIHNRKMCGVVWCYAGPPERFEETFKPVRGFPKPVFEFVGPMPYPAIQSLFDPLLPPGLQWYWKADFVNDLSDEAVRLHVKHGSDLPTPLSTMHLYPINGAAHRVDGNGTAWAYRDATWAEVIVGIDPDPANNDRLIRWASSYWKALHPHSAGGAYVNFMMHDEGQDRIKATYRGNYERLVGNQDEVRPGQFLPGEPEHPARRGPGNPVRRVAAAGTRSRGGFERPPRSLDSPHRHSSIRTVSTGFRDAYTGCRNGHSESGEERMEQAQGEKTRKRRLRIHGKSPKFAWLLPLILLNFVVSDSGTATRS